ncbi:hypothetical protein CI109_101161 [Kwoniella shandongensis]|uniref:Uncharacterized protein n=1 Tax=Kwoniella shandongensis TaxID=1734106 RepID=A0AAJ8MTA4_9TREE
MIRTRWLRSLNGDPFSPRPKVPGRHCLQAFYAWFHSTSITKAAPLLAESFSPPPSSFHTDLDRCGIAGTHIASPKPLGQVSGGSKISLYPYQRAMIQASLQTLASGKRRFAISAPTGSGKTVVFTHLIPLIPDLSESKAGKVLIMLNKVNLVRQTELAVKRMLGGQYLVELEQSDSKASESADIIIGTVQTLRNPDRLRRFDPADFKLVVVDEAHHSAAPSYLQQLHYFNDEVTLPLDTTPISTHSHGHKVPIIGLSATLNRHDGLALGSVFQTIADSTDCRTLIQEGFLARPEIKQVEAELNLEDSDVNKEGEWKTIALAQKVNKTSVNRIIVRTYLEQAKERRSTLVFCVDLDHVEALTKIFQDLGIDARSVSSKMKSDTVQRTLDEFRQGKFPVLINCGILTEGTDIPEIDCIILARPTRSKPLLQQMAGSKGKGQEDADLEPDSADRCEDESADKVASQMQVMDSSASENSEMTPMNEEEDPSGFTLNYIDISNPFRLASPLLHVVNKVSVNAWVACGEDKYVLGFFDRSWLSIVCSLEDSSPWVVQHNSCPDIYRRKHRLRRTVDIGSALSLSEALEQGDRYAEDFCDKDQYSQLSRYAPWRRKPPSPRMIQTLTDIMSSSKKSLKSSTNTDVQKLLDEEVEMAKLTAGEASAIMTAWIHGRKRTPRSGETRHDQVHKRSEREAVSIQISKSPSPVIETVPDSTGESSMKSDSEPWWKVLRQLLW